LTSRFALGDVGLEICLVLRLFQIRPAVNCSEPIPGAKKVVGIDLWGSTPLDVICRAQQAIIIGRHQEIDCLELAQTGLHIVDKRLEDVILADPGVLDRNVLHSIGEMWDIPDLVLEVALPEPGIPKVEDVLARVEWDQPIYAFVSDDADAEIVREGFLCKISALLYIN
jgi:hypothetical protein